MGLTGRVDWDFLHPHLTQGETGQERKGLGQGHTEFEVTEPGGSLLSTPCPYRSPPSWSISRSPEATGGQAAQVTMGTCPESHPPASAAPESQVTSGPPALSGGGGWGAASSQPRAAWPYKGRSQGGLLAQAWRENPDSHCLFSPSQPPRSFPTEDRGSPGSATFPEDGGEQEAETAHPWSNPQTAEGQHQVRF